MESMVLNFMDILNLKNNGLEDPECSLVHRCNNKRVVFPPSMKRFILMDDPSRQYTIVQADLPAANGVIHIIDQPIVKTLFGRSLRDEQVRLHRIKSLRCRSEDPSCHSFYFL